MIKQKFLILLVMFSFALCYIPYTQSEIISEGNPFYTFTMESNSSRIEWIRAYGNLYDDQIIYIFETSDGGFFFISEVGLPPTERYGLTFDNFTLAFVKLDSQGEIEWQGVMDLDPRDYYGFTILDKIEFKDEILLWIFDNGVIFNISIGEKVFTYNLENPIRDFTKHGILQFFLKTDYGYVVSFLNAADNEYLIRYVELDKNFKDIYVFNYSLNFDELSFEDEIDFDNFMEYGKVLSLIMLSYPESIIYDEGNFTVLNNIEGSESMHILKFDSGFDSFLHKSYKYDNSDLLHADFMIKDKKGDYILVGTTANYSERDSLYLLCINNKGIIKWEKLYSQIISENILDSETEGYFITGIISSEERKSDIVLIKTDPYGNEIWREIIGGEEIDISWFSLKTQDGGYLVVGFTSSYGFNQGDKQKLGYNDILLIKIKNDAETEPEPEPELVVSITYPDNDALWDYLPIHLEARVMSNGSYVSGASVRFYLDDAYVGSHDSNSSGYAYLSMDVSEGSHNWYITASKTGYLGTTSVAKVFKYMVQEPEPEPKGIPGFPIQSMVLGIIFVTVFMWMIRKNARARNLSYA